MEILNGALGFDFAEDPYANFWYELTTGLSGALTGVNRTWNIEFLGQTHTINLDNIDITYSPALNVFLTTTSTVACIWVLVKWWKVIIDKLTSGNMDEVLAMNEEERHY